MLDNLSPAMRHLALLALAGVLSFLATNIDLLGLPGGVAGVAGRWKIEDQMRVACWLRSSRRT